MDKPTDDRYETRRRDNGDQARYERKVLKMIGSVIGGMIIAGAVASAVFATDWTIDRGDGVHIPNPACLSKHCHETGIPDAPVKPDAPQEQRGDDHAPEWHKEIHNGFSCAYAGNWVAHPAARPVMTPEHKAAAIQEALDRKASLGDRAKDMVCKPWQVRAGFVIVARL